MCDPRKLRNVPLLRLFWVIISIFCCCFCQICGFQVHPSAPCSITNTGWSKSKGTLFHRKHGSTSSEHLSSIGEVSADMQVTQPGGDEDRINNIGNDDISSRTLLIHWRGEKDVGYSKPLRQLEFRSSLEAELNLLPSVVGGNANKLSVDFVNALNYTGQEKMGNVNIEHFNEGMQFVSLKFDDDAGGESGARRSVPRRSAVRAAERCSLIHALYEVVASSDSLEDLAELAIRDGGFADLFEGGANAKSTWCFRARNYGDASATGDDFEMDKAGRVKRYGSSARSMVVEREGLTALKDLLVRFGGEVDLRNPEIKICLFDGLEGLSSKALARRIATGPKTSVIAPATRICWTNTPLEPIAAFALCNVARIRDHDRVLDPYAGSCTTLLAAAMIAPNCRTVGIEIAHNGRVNRDDVLRDFESRNLTSPSKLIHGDSTDPTIREAAKGAVDLSPFDAIVADPPYGIRESSNHNENSPLEDLFTSIANDRETAEAHGGCRLLKRGGRLVAFVPVTDEQTLLENLPNQELAEKAGLAFEVSREQPLNEKLSRWLVSFVCTR